MKPNPLPNAGQRVLPLLTVLLLTPLAALHAAELKLSAIFTDHMVLQCELAVPIWGSATPGEEIAVEFAGQKKTATADGTGKWLVRLDPLSASAEPRALKANCTVIADVLVGDVWLCSGQSNMGVSMPDRPIQSRRIGATQYPSIRLFTVASNPALAPADTVKGDWKPCSPQTVADFSGVPYFFDRELHREYNVQRRYLVPGQLVSAGRNVIAVRVVSATENAGIWQWGRNPGVPVANPQAVDGLASGPQRNFQILDPLDFLAEFTRPDTGSHSTAGRHLIRYYGWYSNKARGLRRKQAEAAAAAPPGTSASPAAEPAPARSRASQTWAMLIKRVYEIDPLICPRCSGQMKIVAFIEPPQGDVIEKILRHCGRWCPASPRRHRAGTSASTTRTATGTVTRPPRSPGN